MEIRGAPAELIRETARAGQPRAVREFLIDGCRGTGKTLGLGYSIDQFAEEYPGSRQLFVRLVRKSITQSFCPDFESIVLADKPSVRAGARADTRTEYKWANGSILHLAGLDDPGKVYSTSWDRVIVDECAQVTERGYIEFLATLRQWTRGTHAQYLIALTNPRGPNHWLIKRAQAGKMFRFQSFLRDNPKWHTGPGGTWTPEGLAYIGALNALPGVLRRRNYLGEWSAADGLVWETYDPLIHIVPTEPTGPRTHFAAMDWGSTDAGVLMVGAVDKQGRCTIVREIMRTHMSIDWWCNEMLDAQRTYGLRSIVGDPSRPEMIEHWNRQLSRAAKKDIRLAKGANNKRQPTLSKGDMGGLDLVREWFARKKLFFWAGRMRHWPDPERASMGHPCSSTDEIVEYTFWRPPDVEEGTVDSNEKTDPGCFDDGMDCLRYLVRELDDREAVADETRAPNPNVFKFDYEDAKELGMEI